MAIFSKLQKPDNFELHNSLKLYFMNVQCCPSNFGGSESFLEQNSADIFARLRQT